MIAVFWLLLLAPLLAGLLVQRRLQDVFAKYRAIPNRAQVTGAEVATALLEAHGLSGIRVETSPGFLSDHYDGAARALRLSDVVAGERSVAALGIAAHEVSHAYQDAEGSRTYRLRRTVGEPLARLAPWSGLFFIGGFWFDIPVLIVLSLVYVTGLVLFALATLPVEIGASRRAVRLLESTHLAVGEELEEVRRVLTAAAFTYIVGLLRQLGFFLALILLAGAMERAAT